MLLDEPFSNLDAPLRAQLRTEIQNLRTQLEITMIYVTHDQAEALALGDRVAVMGAGQLQQVGPPCEIYDAPANRFVAGFVGSLALNFFPGTIAQSDGPLVFMGLEARPTGASPGFILPLDGQRSAAFRCHLGRRVLLGFRPEHLLVADAATLQAVEFAGNGAILRLTIGQQTIQVRAGATATLTPGPSRTVAFDMCRARVFDATTGGLLR